MLLSGPSVAADRHDNMSGYADKGVTVLVKVSGSEDILVKPIIGEHYRSAQ